MNISDHLQQYFCDYGQRIAQIDYETKKEVSYAELSQAVYNIGRRLQARGLGPGHVVSTFMENSITANAIMLGILQCGATVAPASAAVTKREMEHYITLTKPSAVIAPTATPEQSQYLKTLNLLVFSNEFSSVSELVEAHEDVLPYNSPAELEDIAFLLSSSGTTGLPKAVILTHSNWISALKNLSKEFMKPECAALGLAPLFHAYGLGLMLMALQTGSSLVIMKKFTMTDFITAVKQYQVRILPLLPSLLVRLANESFNLEDLRSIERIYSGAGVICPAIVEKVRSKLHPGVKFYHSYGMTETTHVVALGEVRNDKPGSPGKVVKDMFLKVLDEDGKEVPAGEEGELHISGPMVTPGYYYNPVATAETFRDKIWLRSGDRVCIDNDGYLFYLDRIKDLIKFQGYQVSSSELEKLILEKSRALEVAVVGIDHPVYGEVPRAYVVKDKKSSLNEDDIMNMVSKELSYYKWLRGGVRFVDSLPKTHNLKIQKRILRSMP